MLDKHFTLQICTPNCALFLEAEHIHFTPLGSQLVLLLLMEAEVDSVCVLWVAFLAFFGPNQHSSGSPPPFGVHKVRGVLARFTDLKGERHWEIQGWLLQHQNPSLKCVPMMLLMRETWGLTSLCWGTPPAALLKPLPDHLREKKCWEGQRGGERRMSWTRTCHFKPRFTLNQLKEKRILYLKEEINREREQKKVKWLVGSTKQNQMVLNILTLSKLLLQMRWEGGHYWPFWGDRSHSVLLQNEEG